MKCQTLFSGKNKKKNISACNLLKILPRVLKLGVAKYCHQQNYKVQNERNYWNWYQTQGTLDVHIVEVLLLSFDIILNWALTLTMLWANSADNELLYFSNFSLHEESDPTF